MKSTGLNSRDSWLATTACSLISFLIMMPARLTGLLFVEILGRYDSDRAMASYPLFLSMLVRCLAGPLAGYFGERFGLHVVIMAGCILSAVGVGICFFVEDISTLSVFLGLVYGLGMTFSLTLFPQVLKQHFSKNLTFAISMSMFGACFGGFIFPPIIKWTIQSYGISGSFLIMSGIVLNSLPFAMLLKYLKPKKWPGQKEDKALLKQDDKPIAATTLKSANNGIQKNVGGNVKYCVKEQQDGRDNKLLNNVPSRQVDGEKFVTHFTSLNNECHADSNYLKKDQDLRNDKDDIEQTASLLPSSVPENTEKNFATESKPPNEKPVSKQKTALQSLRIFLDFTFLIMLITQGLEVVVQMLTHTTILDYSRDKGIDRFYEVHFLMTLPLAEVFGRVFLSLIIDKNYVSKLNFTVISFNVLAAIVLVIVWAKTFAVMIFGVAVFGLVTSGLLSVFPMLVFQYIEPKNYIMALASRTFLYGPLSFLCSPLIGHFRGNGGSYDWVYYIQSITMVFCAILTIFTPNCAKRRDRKEEKRREETKMKLTVDA